MPACSLLPFSLPMQLLLLQQHLLLPLLKLRRLLQRRLHTKSRKPRKLQKPKLQKLKPQQPTLLLPSNSSISFNKKGRRVLPFFTS